MKATFLELSISYVRSKAATEAALTWYPRITAAEAVDAHTFGLSSGDVWCRVDAEGSRDSEGSWYAGGAEGSWYAGLSWYAGGAGCSGDGERSGVGGDAGGFSASYESHEWTDRRSGS